MKVIINGVEYVPCMPPIVGSHPLPAILKAIREAIGYTLDDAAHQIGCSKSYIWTAENSQFCPSLRMAARISRAYGITIESMAAALQSESNEA